MLQILLKFLRGGLLSVVMLLLICTEGVVAGEVSGITLKLDVTAPIIRCDATFYDDQKVLTSLLHDGAVIRVTWHLQINQVRRYWLNTEVAAVAITRRVIPDLVSGSWLLTDQNHDITRRVYRVDDAIHFLLNLEKFSVLDYSLLEGAVEYQFIVTADRREGGVDEGWLASLWLYDNVQAETVFSLPQ